MERNTLRTVLLYWFPFIALSTLMALFLYVTTQQIMRQGANDPQLQLARDGANSLNEGGSFDALVATRPFDIKKSLAPFVLVYDDFGQIRASSALFDGKNPTIPAGVLDSAKDNGENRVTWQPERGFRYALVVVRAEGSQAGYVVAGRSLREIESRERQFLLFIIIAWLVSLGVTYIWAWWFVRLRHLKEI